MPGIRLNHPKLRPPPGASHTVYTVETAVLYPVPYMCPLCKRAEERKTIHLRLDAQGNCIVSQQVYAALQKISGMGGLKVTNQVASPPPLSVGAVPQPTQHIVNLPLNSNHKAADTFTKPLTQYESRDRMKSRIRIPKLRFGRFRKES